VTVREWQDQVVFLHRIAAGAADRSYGIHVARLAGLPEAVIARAGEVLHELENERTVDHLTAATTLGSRRRSAAQAELPLGGGAPHPLESALKSLRPETLTPLEALNLLAEWKQRWGGSK
jgi:DNA mismatch repair protein MutS